MCVCVFVWASQGCGACGCLVDLRVSVWGWLGFLVWGCLGIQGFGLLEDLGFESTVQLLGLEFRALDSLGIV